MPVMDVADAGQPILNFVMMQDLELRLPGPGTNPVKGLKLPQIHAWRKRYPPLTVTQSMSAVSKGTEDRNRGVSKNRVRCAWRRVSP